MARNRALFPDETYTASVGLGMYSTAVFEGRCPAGTLAQAIAVAAPEPNPMGIAIDCFDGVSTIDAVYLGGGFGATSASARCAADEVLVGIGGPSSLWAQNVQGICGKMVDVFQGRQSISRILTPQRTSLPANYIRLCPPGMAINGLSGHGFPTLLADFNVHCENLASPATRAEVRLATYGSNPTDSSAPHVDLVKCAGRGAMTALTGLSKGSAIYGFGGACKHIESLSNRARVRSNQGVDTYLAPTIGDSAGEAKFDANSVLWTDATRCPDNAALIGLNIRASSRVHFLQGVCANVEQWTQTATTAPAQATLTGFGSASTGTLFQPRCTRGQLLTGAEVRTSTRNSDGGTTVDFVRPICRDFRAR